MQVTVDELRVADPTPPFVLRVMERAERAGIPHVVPPVVLFGLVLVAAALLQKAYDVRLLTRSSVMALSWLAVGPVLLRDAVRLSDQFMESYRTFFPDDRRWVELRRRHLFRMYSGWTWFGLPWAAVVTTVVVTVLYPKAPAAVLLWLAFSYGLLFLISGIGFWGVRALIVLVRDFCAAGVLYRPYHPDRFGGFAAVGDFAVRGALYFSSGALVMPLALDVVYRLEIGGAGLVAGVAYAAAGLFVGCATAAFLIPMREVKYFADGERLRVTLEARQRLERLVTSYEDSAEHDEHLARRIEFCYSTQCVEIAQLREYPYDLKMMIEIVIAIGVPIAVVVMESSMR